MWDAFRVFTQEEGTAAQAHHALQKAEDREGGNWERGAANGGSTAVSQGFDNAE